MRAATAWRRYRDLHPDFLQGELVVDRVEQSERAFTRHLVATQFNPGAFTDDLGMFGVHFAIEQKRSVSVELLLQLVQSLVGIVRRARFVHNKDHLVVRRIEAEQIDYTRVLDAAELAGIGSPFFEFRVFHAFSNWRVNADVRGKVGVSQLVGKSAVAKLSFARLDRVSPYRSLMR